MEDEQAEIPVEWQIGHHLTWQDGLAMISSVGFGLLVILGGATWNSYLYGPGSLQPVWLQVLVGIVFLVPSAVVMKYLWLLVMSRVVDKANVGPLVSYGIPRRISKFDRAFINRHFRPNRFQPSPPMSDAEASHRSFLYHCIGYLGGSGLAIALSYLPIMHNDSRLLNLAAFFGVVGLLHLGALCFFANREEK